MARQPYKHEMGTTHYRPLDEFFSFYSLFSLSHVLYLLGPETCRATFEGFFLINYSSNLNVFVFVYFFIVVE